MRIPYTGLHASINISAASVYGVWKGLGTLFPTPQDPTTPKILLSIRYLWEGMGRDRAWGREDIVGI